MGGPGQMEEVYEEVDTEFTRGTVYFRVMESLLDAREYQVNAVTGISPSVFWSGSARSCEGRVWFWRWVSRTQAFVSTVAACP
ncbi:hypothetical protein B6R96_33800 [Streptomyces sp. Sge12]|nr:hypothetical protein B6R96_33800 [Streptomyces sp. Sge12]